MEEKDLYILTDGSGTVIAQAIDENDQIHYLVKTAEGTASMPRQAVDFIPKIHEGQSHQEVIHFGQTVSSE